MFTLIFITLFLVGWALTAMLPWVALSIATRGKAGLVYLPLSIFAGVVAALLVPLLGKDDAGGIWLSFLAALLAPAALLAARRFSLAADRVVRGEPAPK